MSAMATVTPMVGRLANAGKVSSACGSEGAKPNRATAMVRPTSAREIRLRDKVVLLLPLWDRYAGCSLTASPTVRVPIRRYRIQP